MSNDLSQFDPQAIQQTLAASAPAISTFLDKFGGWFGWLKEPTLTVLK